MMKKLEHTDIFLMSKVNHLCPVSSLGITSFPCSHIFLMPSRGYFSLINHRIDSKKFYIKKIKFGHPVGKKHCEKGRRIGLLSEE